MQDNINSIVPTKDGSNTLFSKLYNQHYHNPDDGAINEALSKHIIPAFTFHKQKKELNILDICFGIGYNTFSTIYYCLQNNLFIVRLTRQWLTSQLNVWKEVSFES